MLVHIRDGKVIRRYQSESGWVILADGRRVSPPVAGFVDGPDRIVPLVEEKTDKSTRAETVQTRETVVEKDRVVDRVTVEDVPREQLVAEVKADAGRRIEEIMPAYKQRNMLADYIATQSEYGTDTANWPAEKQADLAEGLAAWAQIKAIRARSDELEAMKSIPGDLQDDGLWMERKE